MVGRNRKGSMQEPGSRVALVVGGGPELHGDVIDRLERRRFIVLADADGWGAAQIVHALPELHLLVLGADVEAAALAEALAAVADAHPETRVVVMREQSSGSTPRIHAASNVRLLPARPSAAELDAALRADGG
jgi:hypothetical protein